LGVSHAYCSPYLQAAPHSTHGYDVVDHARVNEELGGADGHAEMSRALRQNGLGQVLDIVPNHMSIGVHDNRWWWDVLKLGRESRYAAYFDIDWEPPESRFRNRVLLPILADHYGRELDRRRIRLDRFDGEPVVAYGEQRLPLAPGSVKQAELDAVNADPDRLHETLERQHYRLAFWRMAGRDLPYRRFFDVSSLAGLRAEREDVFLDTHALILRWLAAGVLDGVRIDHPDGLRDPEEYFRRLRDAAPHAWLVAEKILGTGERLPGGWPVQGTTGYEFLNLVCGLHVDPAAEEALTRFYAEFTGETRSFLEVATEKKELVLRTLLWADVSRLADLFVSVCEANRRYRDFTRWEIHEVLTTSIACLPVYRTYVRPGTPVREEDAEIVRTAVVTARARRPDLDAELFEFLADVLLLRWTGPGAEELVARFQQTSGPAAAKGVEDTAFYCYNRLVCLNEVGGDPGRWATSQTEFERFCEEAAARHPAAMLSTSTHDTKRSEDVRARIALLSEIPERWRAAVTSWSRHNERHRHRGMPDRNAEYLYYQTLVGAHPLSIDRAVAYMQKAAYEAKEYTSWIDPEPGYDAALRAFVEATLRDAEFTGDLAAFVEPLVTPGRIAALSQKLLCLTAPGVPDVYRGTELWDLSLVDPDNRRPVDFDLRRRLLAELDSLTVDEVLARVGEGLPKLLLVSRTLRLRRSRPDAFGASAFFRPLEVSGERSAHLVAFERGGAVVALAPRLVLGLAGNWHDTKVALPAGSWRDELTGCCEEGGERRVAELLGRFPVGLLSRL
jgi:(1->4)-alpha-D-glucan 1-alpha-D-glucosylmutase